MMRAWARAYGGRPKGDVVWGSPLLGAKRRAWGSRPRPWPPLELHDFWLSGRRRNARELSVDALDVGQMPCHLGKGQRRAEVIGRLVDVPAFFAIHE